MNKRRDQLKAMMAPIVAAPSAGDERARVSSVPGSLKAMGLSLKSLSDDADEAHSLRAQMASGSQIIELDPTLIDSSFVQDRLDQFAGEEFETFKDSLARDGQQVPILVRPHPAQARRYQAAYGHRRVAALRALRQPVKAIVRDLTDEQLIVAQGKENTDRKDLSFIERALFAARLEERGFSRTALIAALSVQKGNLSTMISVVRGIPEEMIVAIGAAPKIGRPRWEQLAALIKNDAVGWRRMIADPAFAAASSDQRFEKIFRAASLPAPQEMPDMIKTADGRTIASIARAKNEMRLIINVREQVGFGDYLAQQLPDIYAAFQRRADA